MKINYSYLKFFNIIVFLLFQSLVWGQLVGGEPIPGTGANPCADNGTCENGGTCIVDSTSQFGFICECPVGYIGQYCDLFLDPPMEAVLTLSPLPKVTENDINVLLNGLRIDFGTPENEQLFNQRPDIDIPSATFVITGGTLSLGTNGMTFTGDGNGSDNFIARGTTQALNEALHVATFTPTPNLDGLGVASIQFNLNAMYNGWIPASSITNLPFDIIALECSWTEWSDWSVCENAGIISTRECLNNSGEICDNCEGENIRQQECDLDADGFVASVDCNDSNSSINPAAVEICDGIDNNCNGLVDEGIDADNDGTADCYDNCPTDANKTEPGICGCGIQDLDNDEDGMPNCNDECPNDPNKTVKGDCGCGIEDLDDDGDGVANCIDICEGSDIDSDGDGTLDCNDLCPYDANKIAEGDCGCGLQDLDDDQDGTPNCMETDDDEDGVENCNDIEPNSPCPNLVDEYGVSIDTDGDLVLDCNDEEINSPCPDKVNELGVSPAVDSDSDGIIDCLDDEVNSQCPTEVDSNGVSLDSDGDGIPDCIDTCAGVLICHVKKNGDAMTVCVSQKELERHLKHSNDNLNGACSLSSTGKSQTQQLDIIPRPVDQIKNNLKIVPNPASNRITIFLLENVGNDSVLSIFNVNGVLIETKTINGEKQIDVNINNNYSSGIYLAVIQDRGNIFDGRFIVKK